MNSLATDPSRFTLYRESVAATVIRTGGIAIIVATLVTVARLRHLPASSAEWYGWLVLVVFVGWFSFGGHWVELAYLNGIRPKIAHWSDPSLVFIRLGVWLIGGAILYLGAVASRSVMTAGELPGQADLFKVLLYGGPVFAVIELFPHTFLQLSGKPSFWNFRG